MSVDFEPARLPDDGLVPLRNRWVFSRPKLYGWLVGVFSAFFGGLLYTSPAATYIGLPHIIVGMGLMLSVSYSVAMSATSVRHLKVILMAILALTLIVLGRFFAPIAELMSSIREGKDYIKGVGPITSMGFPMVLIGLQVLQLAIPWLRDPRRLSWWRGTLSMLLIQGGAFLLATAAVLTPRNQPLSIGEAWPWIAVPVAFGLAMGLRNFWQGRSWMVMTVLIALALPATWLVCNQIVAVPTEARHLPSHPPVLVAAPHDRLHGRLT